MYYERVAEKLYPENLKAHATLRDIVKASSCDLTDTDNAELTSKKIIMASGFAKKIIKANELAVKARKASDELLIGSKILPDFLE